jgi:predicted AlkP superfamily phosphohydrolase/phosphomutase
MMSQVLLIGIDGATFSILDPLMDQGVMPFLKQFVASGVRAELLSVIPPLTPPAWTSLVTGCSPGQHGIFDFFRKESPDSHHIRIVNSHDVGCETIWSIASRNGLKATSLNFPVMFPPPRINGNVVPGGWMPWRQLRLGCHPPDLYDQLKALPGFNARELALDMAHEEKAIEGCQHEEYEGWIEQHIRREQQWFDVLRYLMQEDPCELTAILFDGVDKLQHLCWRFLHPAYLSDRPDSWEQRVRDLCLQYFRQLDRLLVDTAHLAGPEATIIMASDHGFGAQTETFFASTWLEQNGYLTWVDEAPSRETNAAKLGIGQLARHAYMLDWERTVAYAPTPSSNGIHIVRADGQGGRGIAPADYDQFRAQLMASLSQVTSPDTGERVVSHIWTREEAFEGPYAELAPDLTLTLSDGGLISILASDAPVKARAEPSGTHRPEGIFIAAGRGVRRGVSLPQLSILDIAPMVLYGLGLAIPGDMTGHVPTEAFESSWLQARPVRITGHPRHSVVGSQQDPVEIVYTEEEERELAARLRALGYIE